MPHRARILFVGVLGLLPIAPAAGASRLAGLELKGVSGIGERMQVCLVDRGSAGGRWYTVGVERFGVLAERYDAAETAVLIRSGGEARWIELRDSKIKSIPVARNENGTVDWIHMNMTDREKEAEAQALHGDMLQISYLGRTGRLARPSTKQRPPQNHVLPPTERNRGDPPL